MKLRAGEEEIWANSVTDHLPDTDEVDLSSLTVTVKSEPRPLIWPYLVYLVKYPYLILRWFFKNRPKRRTLARWNQIAHSRPPMMAMVEKVGTIEYPLSHGTYNVNQVKVWQNGIPSDPYGRKPRG